MKLYALVILVCLAGCGESDTDPVRDATTTQDATSSDATSSDATSSDATSSDATSSDATSPACNVDDDCQFAVDWSRCCPQSRCAGSYPKSVVAENPCLVDDGSENEACLPSCEDDCPGPPFQCGVNPTAVCVDGTCQTQDEG